MRRERKAWTVRGTKAFLSTMTGAYVVRVPLRIKRRLAR